MIDPTDGILDTRSMLVFFFLFAAAIFNFGLIARWYVWPALSARSLDKALEPLLQFTILHYLGSVTLAPSQVAGHLPQGWAWTTAVGDVSSAVIAVLTLFAVRRKWSVASSLVWFSIVYSSIAIGISVVGAIKLEIPELAGSYLYIIATLVIPAALIVIVLLVALMRSGKSLREA